MNEEEQTEGGSTVLRYKEPKNTDLAVPATAYLEEITAHVNRFIGPTPMVLHEIVSTAVHIDVLTVPPTESRPFLTFVTSGMSDRPMSVPKSVPNHTDLHRAEMMISLPIYWAEQYSYFEHYKVTDGDEQGYYPIRYLKYWARFPHEFETWLGTWHTMPNGDPPQPLDADTEMTGFMILPPATLLQEAWSFRASDGELINLLALYPLHAEEMEFKLANGAEALVDMLIEAGVTEVFEPRRKSVVKRKKRFGLF